MPDETLLAIAERHLVEGELRVSHQRELVARLEANGQDTATARRLLATLEKVRASMAADLEVARQLAAPAAHVPPEIGKH